MPGKSSMLKLNVFVFVLLLKDLIKYIYFPPLLSFKIILSNTFLEESIAIVIFINYVLSFGNKSII